MPGKRRNQAEWQALFRAFEDSGLSNAAFCDEQDLPAAYFRTKYLASHPSPPGFRRVTVASAPAMVSVSMGDVQIRCDAAVPCQWLAELVRQIRA